MKNLLIITLLVVSFVFMSCQKEPSADILRMETVLKSIIEENSIKTCDVLTERHKALVPEYENVEFVIDRGLLKIATEVMGKPFQHAYSLEYLSTYTINAENVLVLHFALERTEQNP
jgi:hypothetical protein